MSEEMAGNSEAYIQGYDKGYEDGKKFGYLAGLASVMKKLAKLSDDVEKEVTNG